MNENEEVVIDLFPHILWEILFGVILLLIGFLISYHKIISLILLLMSLSWVIYIFINFKIDNIHNRLIDKCPVCEKKIFLKKYIPELEKDAFTCANCGAIHKDEFNNII